MGNMILRDEAFVQLSFRIIPGGNINMGQI